MTTTPAHDSRHTVVGAASQIHDRSVRYLTVLLYGNRRTGILRRKQPVERKNRMRASKQGAKSARREKHLAHQRAMHERKVRRRKRAAIHAAIGQSAKMVRSKRKGCRNFDENMRGLGFEPKETIAADGSYVCGREIRGDVLAKYEQKS